MLNSPPGWSLQPVFTGDNGEVFMDVRYINAFIGAITNTFETMCQLSVTVGKPQRKIDGKPETDVSAVIGFSGDAAGCVVLHFSFETASKIASAFAGIDITPQHPDFADALGELANMVAGGAKAKFDGMNITISLPNVIVGSNHHVSASKATPRLVIPCATKAGEFHVELGMELLKPSGTPMGAATVGANP